MGGKKRRRQNQVCEIPYFSNAWFRVGFGEGKTTRFCDSWVQRDCVKGDKCKYFHYCSIRDSFSLFTTLEAQQKKVVAGTNKQVPPQPTSSSIPSTSNPQPFQATKSSSISSSPHISESQGAVEILKNS